MKGSPETPVSLELVVADVHGMHLRNAGLLANLVSRFKSRVTVTAGDKTVNARSMLALVTLGAVRGTRLRFRAAGRDSAEALRAVQAFLQPGGSGEQGPSGQAIELADAGQGLPKTEDRHED